MSQNFHIWLYSLQTSFTFWDHWIKIRTQSLPWISSSSSCISSPKRRQKTHVISWSIQLTYLFHHLTTNFKLIAQTLIRDLNSHSMSCVRTQHRSGTISIVLTLYLIPSFTQEWPVHTRRVFLQKLTQDCLPPKMHSMKTWNNYCIKFQISRSIRPQLSTSGETKGARLLSQAIKQ